MPENTNIPKAEKINSVIQEFLYTLKFSLPNANEFTFEVSTTWLH